MQVITPTETRLRKEEIKEMILRGDVFIHPTDTIYGLGCDATNPKAVQKIREMKKRPETPFSIIAPSKEWIEEHCVISKDAKGWLNKLPGPYTFILKTKKQAVAPNVAPKNDTLGVRIPAHWFSKFVGWLGTPVVTTSVNVTDEPFMTKLEDLDMDMNEGIRHKLSFVIYEEEKQGKPSKIVHLEGEEVKIRER